MGNECTGANLNSIQYVPSNLYSFNSFSFAGMTSQGACVDKLLNSSIDSVAIASDNSQSCESIHCYIHSSFSSNCNFSASERTPSDYIYYYSSQSENSCYSMVDGINYSSAVWDVPNATDCPLIAYCFLKPIQNNIIPDLNNTNPNNNLDLNSTSLDNQALLEAQNQTNRQLEDLKNKADNHNNKLDDLKAINNNILSSNKELKSNLDNMQSQNDRLFFNSNLMNSTLSTINQSILSSNSYDRSIRDGVVNMNSELDRITQNTQDIEDKLEDGLFSDVNPFDGEEYLDGSETFNELETEVSNNFDITNENNIFGLANISGGGLGTYSASFHGTTVIFFEPSMLNGFPIDEIRALFLFIFAILGFVQTFRSV